MFSIFGKYDGHGPFPGYIEVTCQTCGVTSKIPGRVRRQCPAGDHELRYV